MKVVSVMTAPTRGGAEFAAVELLDALAERGHEVVLLSNHEGMERGTRVVNKPAAIGPKMAVRTWPLIAATWPLMLVRLRRKLEREAPYDVLLVHFHKEELLAALLPRRLRPRLAWCHWGPVPFPLRRGPARWLTVWSSRAADVVLAISEGTRESTASIGVDASKIAVLANAVRAGEIRFDPEGRDRVRAAMGIPPDAFVVGCVSRFQHKKRNDVVVDACLGLGDDVHLVLAGEGETEDELRGRGAAMGERLHVRPGPGRDVAELLSAFDVSVFCPSPTEGAPRAVILAQLCERPVVATGGEGVRHLIGDGYGAIVEPENDPAALAAELVALRDDPPRRQREGQESRRRAAAVHDFAAVGARAEALMLGTADPAVAAAP